MSKGDSNELSLLFLEKYSYNLVAPRVVVNFVRREYKYLLEQVARLELELRASIDWEVHQKSLSEMVEPLQEHTNLVNNPYALAMIRQLDTDTGNKRLALAELRNHSKKINALLYSAEQFSLSMRLTDIIIRTPINYDLDSMMRDFISQYKAIHALRETVYVSQNSRIVSRTRYHDPILSRLWKVWSKAFSGTKIIQMIT